ncbi:MAG: SUMF1/EgtB/PvdO family nonheme iron enzyme, partial [Caldilineaceae bacterium]|nr:SUMF1/EgtB/PvdO family nonheme iron enzyme [Caldilineaceae bacterium]
GARTSREDPLSGVAQHLVQQGIPAVIAMQFEITDQAAITLSHEFYTALADGYPVDGALAEARKAIYAMGNDIEWGTPVLYMRARDGVLFEVDEWRSGGVEQTASSRVELSPLVESEEAVESPFRGRLSGEQVRVLQQALLEAFDRSGLRMLMRMELDENLESVASSGDLATTVFELIEWAERHNRLGDLMAGALRQNPRNVGLRAAALEVLGVDPSPGPSPDLFAREGETRATDFSARQEARVDNEVDTREPVSPTEESRKSETVNTSDLAQPATPSSTMDATAAQSGMSKNHLSEGEGQGGGRTASIPKRIFVDEDENATASTPIPFSSIPKPKNRWLKIAIGLIVTVGVMVLSAIGLQTYQTNQRNARATATARAIATATSQAIHAEATLRVAQVAPTATAMAQNPRTVMEQQASQLLPFAERYDMQFVPISAGEFIMGSTEAEIDAALDLCNQFRSSPCERDWFTDEAPQHTVTTGAYWIGLTEVTNAQYRPFIDAGGYEDEQWWTAAGWQWRSAENISEPRYWTDSTWNGDDQPVVGISWHEATAYAKWLSQDIGVTVRLPSEAEWERAARGDKGLIFPWGKEWNGALANYCDANCTNAWKDESVNDGYQYTAPVGKYPDGASPYGALDMAGNVWEWTSSLDLAYPYSADGGREDVEGEGSRVLRGGS